MDEDKQGWGTMLGLKISFKSAAVRLLTVDNEMGGWRTMLGLKISFKSRAVLMRTWLGTLEHVRRFIS